MPTGGNPHGIHPIVDMGAYESQHPCPWDLDSSGDVDITADEPDPAASQPRRAYQTRLIIRIFLYQLRLVKRARPPYGPT